MWIPAQAALETLALCDSEQQQQQQQQQQEQQQEHHHQQQHGRAEILYHAAVAVGQAGLHTAPAGRAILAGLVGGAAGAAGAGSSAHSGGSDMSSRAAALAALHSEQLVDLVHTYAWQLRRPRAQAPAPQETLPTHAAVAQGSTGARNSGDVAAVPAVARMALAALAARPKQQLAPLHPQQLHGVVYGARAGESGAAAAAAPVLRMVSAGYEVGVAGEGSSGDAGTEGQDGSAAVETVPLQWLLHRGGGGLWAVPQQVGAQVLELLGVLGPAQVGVEEGWIETPAHVRAQRPVRQQQQQQQQQQHAAGVRNGRDVEYGFLEAPAAAAATASLMALLASSPTLLQPHANVRALAAAEAWGPCLAGMASGPGVLAKAQEPASMQPPDQAAAGSGWPRLRSPSTVQGGALLLQASSLAAWAGIGSGTAYTAASSSSSSSSSASSSWDSDSLELCWYTPGQLARLARSYGKVRWRPGALLRDLVSLMRGALRESRCEARRRAVCGRGLLLMPGVWGREYVSMDACSHHA